MDALIGATARAEDRHFWFRALRRNADRWLRDAMAGRPAPRLLDCGAGTGRNLDWLQGHGEAFGVDRSPAALDVARARGRRRLARASVTALPFPDASMDVVTSFDVLYCLDDASERAAAAEMWRVLRPGGVALVNVAALDILRGAHSRLSHEVRRYSRARLTQLLEHAGLRIERLSFTNMVTLPLTLAIRSCDRLAGRDARESAAELAVPPAPINALLGGALRLEGALLRWIDLPVGSSLLCVARKPAATAGPPSAAAPR